MRPIPASWPGGPSLLRFRHGRRRACDGRRGLDRHGLGSERLRLCDVARGSVIEDIVSGWILELLDLPRHRASGSPAAVTWRTSPAWPRRVMKSCGARAGTSRRRACRRRHPCASSRPAKSTSRRSARLRYLGFGTDEIELVPVDDRGRMRADALTRAVANHDGPTIVCAQAGNVSTGAQRSDWRDRAERPRAKRVGPCRRRLWSVGRRRPRNAHRRSGNREGRLVGDRRAQMAQRALRLRPRDRRRRCPASRRHEHEGVVSAARRRRRAHRHGLGAGVFAPRRALPLYALFHSLGGDGIADIVRRNCALARRMATACRRNQACRS